MYGSGEGLCNKMWGEAFYYSSDTDNCTVMAFNSSMVNPNIRLTFPKILPGVSGNGSIQSTVMYGSVLIIMLLIVAELIYNWQYYTALYTVLTDCIQLHAAIIRL